jgi:hypothetical protein
MELLSLPDDWKFSIRGLAKVLHLAKDTVMRHLDTLTRHEYCHRKKQSHASRGRFASVDYTLFETTELARSFDSPCPTNKDTAEATTSPPRPNVPYTDSPDVLNTNPTEKSAVALAPAGVKQINRQEGPYTTLIALFFRGYADRIGFAPPWTGIEGKLLKVDLARLGVDRLASLVRLFFADPPGDVSQFCDKAGWGYRIFHSQLIKLEPVLAEDAKRLSLVRTCPTCGRQQTHTGQDCIGCGKPLRDIERAI